MLKTGPKNFAPFGYRIPAGYTVGRVGVPGEGDGNYVSGKEFIGSAPAGVESCVVVALTAWCVVIVTWPPQLFRGGGRCFCQRRKVQDGKAEPATGLDRIG